MYSRIPLGPRSTGGEDHHGEGTSGPQAAGRRVVAGNEGEEAADLRRTQQLGRRHAQEGHAQC